jgi:hypothetical protein
MKRILCAIALLLALTSLAACSPEVPDVPEGMIEISNDKVDYHLYVPDKWTAETSTGVITAKYSDSIMVNVSMMAATATPETADIESYWNQYTDNFSATIEDFELIKKNEAVLLDGHEAARYVYKGTVAGSVEAQYQQIICIKDGVIYIFTYTASPDKYEEYLPDVADMLKNFKFKD